MASIPDLISELYNDFFPFELEEISAETPHYWATPLSYTVNRFGHVITLNLSNSKLEKLNITQNWIYLQRLNISRNAFTELVFTIDMPQLELLEASYNTVLLEKLVFAAPFAKLHYLYVHDSGLKEIAFKKGLPKLLVEPDLNINLNKNNLKDDRLRGILDIENLEQQRKEMISYFKVLTQESVTIKRAKLILLGNTGAGKTTLYDILKNDTKATKGSTHGINQFSYPVGDIRVEGFDFGGQDYYHSTHVPFFSNNALYILVWGKGQKDAFDRNPDGDNLLPLNYWLGCVQYFNREKDEKKSNTDNLETVAADDLGRAGQVSPSLEVAEPEDGTIPSTTPLTNTNKKLHFLQNMLVTDKVPTPLNSWDIQRDYPFTESYGHFCFTQPEHQAKIADWINERIIDFAQTNKVPAVDEAVEKLFEAHPSVLFSMDELFNKPEVNGLSQEECTHLAKRLHRNLSCYYLDENEVKPITYDVASAQAKGNLSEQAIAVNSKTPENAYDPLSDQEKQILSSTIIIDLEVFTDWVYAILAKKLTNDGYFTQAAAMTSLKANKKIKREQEAMDNLPFILAFMLHHKIIFRVEDKDRYIAPNYLPATPDKAAELLLGTFEPALVKYRFTGFFHSNIITEILARFFNNLLVTKEGDKTAWKYLLWKNKVLLYEKPADAIGTNEATGAKASSNKKLLYIHFEFPDPNNKGSDPLPTISIHRFAKNHVSDAFLKQVMDFIKIQIASYQTQQWVITPSHEYIPFEEVAREIKQDGRDSNLVYHNSKIYRKGDFNLFLDEKDKSPMKRLFISYSKDDLPMVNQFLKHLAPLQRSGLLERWYCTELLAGSDWDATIQTHFDAADMVCFMVSPNFNATNYIYEYELKKAIDRKNNDNSFVIVPIIMEYCSWAGSGNYDLTQYTALPYIAKPVSDFRDPNMAWYVVTESLKYLVLNFNQGLAEFNNPSQNKELRKIFERIVEGKVDNDV